MRLHGRRLRSCHSPAYCTQGCRRGRSLPGLRCRSPRPRGRSPGILVYWLRSPRRSAHLVPCNDAIRLDEDVGGQPFGVAFPTDRPLHIRSGSLPLDRAIVGILGVGGKKMEKQGKFEPRVMLLLFVRASGCAVEGDLGVRCGGARRRRGRPARSCGSIVTQAEGSGRIIASACSRAMSRRARRLSPKSLRTPTRGRTTRTALTGLRKRGYAVGIDRADKVRSRRSPEDSRRDGHLPLLHSSRQTQRARTASASAALNRAPRIRAPVPGTNRNRSARPGGSVR